MGGWHWRDYLSWWAWDKPEQCSGTRQKQLWKCLSGFQGRKESLYVTRVTKWKAKKKQKKTKPHNQQKTHAGAQVLLVVERPVREGQGRVCLGSKCLVLSVSLNMFCQWHCWKEERTGPRAVRWAYRVGAPLRNVLWLTTSSSFFKNFF